MLHINHISIARFGQVLKTHFLDLHSSWEHEEIFRTFCVLKENGKAVLYKITSSLFFVLLWFNYGYVKDKEKQGSNIDPCFNDFYFESVA